MKPAAQRKVLTPRRPTGGGAREQQARKGATSTPGPAEPAYSLYSSDPREQVDSLHLGLDRCAALLSGLLQVHKADPSPRPLREVKVGAAKPKLSTPLRRKTGRKAPTQTEQYWNVARGAQCQPPASHAGVKHALMQPRFPPSPGVMRTLPGSARSQPNPAPRSTSERLTPAQTDQQPPGGHHTTSFNGEEVDAVPVKDGDAQSETRLCVQEKPEPAQLLQMQKELSLAQSRLEELQADLAEMKDSLLDTKKQLQGTEAENMQMKSDLESIRTKLVHSEQAKSKLASLAQQRLEEIESLKRIIQSGTAPRENHDDRSSATQHVAKYVATLRQSQAGAHVHLATESEGGAPEETPGSPALLGKESSIQPHRPDAAHRVAHEGVPFSVLQIGKTRRRLFDSFLSLCDADSVSSDCSLRSVSTFDTKDEVAFQDGLAALDASIASLQKTIQLDLAR